MDKIDNFNFFNEFLPTPKKKKSDRSKKDKKIESEFESSFSRILETTENELELKKIEEAEKELEVLLKNIGKQGEKLKKSRTLKDLDIYKKYINKYLLLFTAHAEKLEKKTVWNRISKQKISKVHLTIINNELAELTKFFFKEQQNTFAIASKIDKIEGLLIDLCS